MLAFSTKRKSGYILSCIGLHSGPPEVSFQQYSVSHSQVAGELRSVDPLQDLVADRIRDKQTIFRMFRYLDPGAGTFELPLPQTRSPRTQHLPPGSEEGWFPDRVPPLHPHADGTEHLI